MNFVRNSSVCVIIATFFLTACTTAKRKPVLVPEIGSTATRGVGEELLVRGTGVIRPILITSKDQLIGETLLPQGRYASISENAEFIRFGQIELGPIVAGVPVKKVSIFLRKIDKMVCVGKDNCSVAEFTTDSLMKNVSKNSFQQTLLYNGMVGNRISLGYREFQDNMARPAFSNAVDYDLSKSNILGYKGARIEIVNANNSEITYKVLSGFD